LAYVSDFKRHERLFMKEKKERGREEEEEKKTGERHQDEV